MKTLLTIAILIVSQFASANQRFPLAADFVVQYYTNEMPQIIIDDQVPVGVREVWSVLATVEFCATVSAEMFELEVQVEQRGNVLQLTADQGLVDCMGPTRRQTLRYSMPDDADTSLGFYTFSPIRIDYQGSVH